MDSSAVSLREQLTKCLDELQTVWTQIGLPKEQRAERLEEVSQLVKGVFSQIVAQELEQKRQLEETVKSDKQTLQDLCIELELPFNPPGPTTALLAASEQLEQQIMALQEERENRLERLVALESKLEELRHDLAIRDARASMAGDDISLQRIEKLSRRVEHYEHEKQERAAAVHAAMDSVTRIWRELGHAPTEEFAQAVARGDDFALSTENIKALQQLKTDAERLRAERLKLITELSTTITGLATKLQIPDAEQESFMRRKNSIHSSVVDLLEREVTRLRALRQTHMDKFISGTRAELEAWWAKSFSSAAARLEFERYVEQMEPEEMLQAMEEELARVQKLYVECEPMYHLIERRQELLDQLTHMESQATAADRLANRGGVLLREERMRKMVAKEMPKIERQLRAELRDWEDAHGRPFVVGNARLLDVLAAEDSAAVPRQPSAVPASATKRREPAPAAPTPAQTITAGPPRAVHAMASYSTSGSASALMVSAGAAVDPVTPKRKANEKSGNDAKTPRTAVRPLTALPRPTGIPTPCAAKTPATTKRPLQDANARAFEYGPKEVLPVRSHIVSTVSSLHGSFAEFVRDAEGVPRSSVAECADTLP